MSKFTVPLYTYTPKINNLICRQNNIYYTFLCKFIDFWFILPCSFSLHYMLILYFYCMKTMSARHNSELNCREENNLNNV